MHPAQIINENLLPYAHRLVSRPTDSIDLVVIHCTELPDLATAREYGQYIHYPDSGTGNSGHFYIERNGNVEQWVPLDRVAHHVRNYNERSIGIELVNTGRFPDWCLRIIGEGLLRNTLENLVDQLDPKNLSLKTSFFNTLF